MIPIEEIQAYLREHELDGWLLADFHGRNEIMIKLLGLEGVMITRRSFYLIPAEGEPTLLVNAVEKSMFGSVRGKLIAYSGYKMLEAELQKTLRSCFKVAMEYSPAGRLPYIALVDAGTIEMVRSFDCEVVSSANLVAHFQARLTPEQLATHRMAAHNVMEIKDKAFAFIKTALSDNRKITEYDVVQYIKKLFTEYDMVTHDNPICGVGKNAGNPHYDPSESSASVIEKNQLVLLDIWAKLKHPDGTFADITWIGFTGTQEVIPSRFNELFQLVCKGRDAAVAFIRERIDNQPVFGSDVDDACRQVFIDAGLDKHFVHRTGHSITTDIHGSGPNIDNIETEDSRRLQQGHMFSIEPGLYFDDCGFRSEIDVYITPHGAEIATLPLQTEIKALFE